MTLLHFSLQLLEITSYYLKILQSHCRGVLLMAADRQEGRKEGMSNLFLVPIFRECAFDHFLTPVTDRGLGKSLNMS